MKQCKKCGNAYEEKYASCPYCSGERQVVTTPLPQPGAFSGPTIPLKAASNNDPSDMGVTTAPGSGGEPFPPTVPGNNVAGIPDTTPPDEPKDADTKFGPTQIHVKPIGANEISEPTGNTLPLRGWLVVTQGIGLGQDFRVHDAANIIGRSERADINLYFDGYVSHESAIVTFDGRNNKFYISCHPFTKNNVYVNKDILLAPIELHDYDVVEIGRTELTFRSFCNKDYNYPFPIS